MKPASRWLFETYAADGAELWGYELPTLLSLGKVIRARRVLILLCFFN